MNLQNPPAPPSLDPPLHEFDLGGELARWFGRIVLGPAQTARSAKSLEVSPLVLEGEPGEPFLLLHEALESGALEVTEQGEGSVNEVIAHNRGDRPILILEGESVRGAKQNRVITVDVLVAAGASVTVFVGCVEQGRWDDSKASFGSSPMMVEPMLRAANKVQSTRGGKIDQRHLWRLIGRKLAGSRVASESSSYVAFMEQRGGPAEEDARALEPATNQVGILALDGGRLVALDLLGHPRNWSAVSHRLASSYLLGGFDDEPEFASRPRRSREEWLSTIAAAPVTTRPSAGLGRQIVLSDPQLVGGGLWHEGRPAHLSVFGAAAATQPGHWVVNT